MDVILHMSWSQEVRGESVVERRRDRYEAIKQRLGASREDASLDLHAFTYAFLSTAKNVDLFLDADTTGIRDRLVALRAALLALEAFERDGANLPARLEHLRAPYLRLRRVMLRASARDEHRVLTHLLMTGPASAAELVAALELPSPSGAVRALLALAPVVLGEPTAGERRFEIQSELLPVALFAVRERMGLDPLALLLDLSSNAELR